MRSRQGVKNFSSLKVEKHLHLNDVPAKRDAEQVFRDIKTIMDLLIYLFVTVQRFQGLNIWNIDER